MKHILFIFIVLCGSLSGTVPEEIVENIEYILQSTSKIPIIAIGGCPGVGKTTFANVLQERLSEKNIHSVIVNFDDFGKSQDERKELRNEMDIMRIRWSDLYSVLEEIKSGSKRISKPKINQLTKERTEETLNLDGIDLVLFEGMYSLSDTDDIRLLPYMDLGIYMETTAENICQWKWEREIKRTAPRTSEQFEAHMTLIFEDFIRFVYPTKRNADFVVFSNDQHELAVVK